MLRYDIWLPMFCTVPMGDLWHSYIGSTSVLPDTAAHTYSSSQIPLSCVWGQAPTALDTTELWNSSIRKREDLELHRGFARRSRMSNTCPMQCRSAPTYVCWRTSGVKRDSSINRIQPPRRLFWPLTRGQYVIQQS